MLRGSILEKLTTHHLISKKPLNLGVYYKNTLIALCHALEDFILESEGNPLMIAAFQRGKWYLQEADRYGKLAEKAKEIVILAAPETGFAEHNTSKLSNVSLVSLQPTDPVASEWHLMIFSPAYSAMVLCQELSEEDYGSYGRPSQDLERKFYGFWTFESELVQETIELTLEHLESVNPALAKSLTEKLQQLTKGSDSIPEQDVSEVVSRVVDYLETSQKNLANPAKILSLEFSQALTHNLFSNKMQAFLRMAQIIDQSDANNPAAASEVASLAEAMGQLLDLPAWQIKRLRLAALLHRLPPLKGTTPKTELKTPLQQATVQQEAKLPKASVVRIMPQLQAIAKIITHQSECWDGSGGPEGLAYDNIPLESRILALVADFQQQVLDNGLNEALKTCQTKASTVYDPKLVQTLELLVLAMEQGMSLEGSKPKIASGMWLLEEDNPIEQQLG